MALHHQPKDSQMLRPWISHKLTKLLTPYKKISKRSHLVRTYQDLQQILQWEKMPTLEGDHLHEFRNSNDVNNRWIKDALMVAGACANTRGSTIVEIGTAHGHMTYHMAVNAPHAQIHTVNLPPEEKDQGGKLITFAPQKSEIGQYFRQHNIENITQIYANSLTWQPQLKEIDVAFIDGCHDTDFVYKDTLKILKYAKPGTVILWHDFAPEHAHRLDWIHAVCQGVENLLAKKLHGNVYHLQDSWVGLYIVQEKDLA